MLDRALAQPREWACEWKASKGRRALWAERCRYMEGMTVGAVTAGGRGDWLRQGVRVGCIVVRRRQEEDTLEAEQGRTAIEGRGGCTTGQGEEGGGPQGSTGVEEGDRGVESGRARQAEGSAASREGSRGAGTSGQRWVGGDRTSEGWGSALWADTDPQFLAMYEEPSGAECLPSIEQAIRQWLCAQGEGCGKARQGSVRWRAHRCKRGSRRCGRGGGGARAGEGCEGTVGRAEDTRSGGSAGCMGRTVPASWR